MEQPLAREEDKHFQNTIEVQPQSRQGPRQEDAIPLRAIRPFIIGRVHLTPATTWKWEFHGVLLRYSFQRGAGIMPDVQQTGDIPTLRFPSIAHLSASVSLSCFPRRRAKWSVWSKNASRRGGDFGCFFKTNCQRPPVQGNAENLSSKTGDFFIFPCPP